MHRPHPLNSLATIQLYLKTIIDNLPLKNQHSFLPGEIAELATLPEMSDLLQRLMNNTISRNHAIEFLNKRWFRIVNTPLCYTRNPSHPLNVVCIQLAQLLDPRNRNSLLMPTVANADTFGYEINALEFGEFALNDAGTQFITLEALVESACARLLKNEHELFITTNEQGRIRPLSDSERVRCKNIISIVESVQSWFIQHQGNVLGLLATLRDTLLRGDARHGGEELNAGREANIGILNFSIFYRSMSEEDRRHLRAFNDPRVLIRGGQAISIGDVLDHLFREPNQNYREVRFCIEMLGGFLQGIIEANAIALSGFSAGNPLANRNLINMINLVKVHLSGQDMEPELVLNGRANEQRLQSRINSELTFSENEYVVSLIAPQSKYYIPTHTKILVEGIKNGRLFVGSYYVVAQPASHWRILPEQVQNTGGIFTKVKMFESRGYANVPHIGANGHLQIDEAANVAIKFDQLGELRRSLSRSHQVPVDNVMDMIKSIKSNELKTELAHWIMGTGHELTKQEVDVIMTNNQLRSLFIPFERFGKYSFFGNGNNNCVSWCEEKLSTAGCGKLPAAIDHVKAKPILHVSFVN